MIQATPRTFADLVGWPRYTPTDEQAVHGTTVLSLRYDQGVLVLADRRATMGNLVMYERADKVFPLDDTLVMAISGSFARSLEICRFLRHSLKYYRRMALHDMSLEGKLMEVSRALAGNLPAAMNGVGVFIPIVAAYDPAHERFEQFFFDGAGARFENGGYACAGSGSERIRGVFEYLSRTKGAWDARPLEEVLTDGLTMLDIAADLDSATGGFAKVLPSARILTREGNQPVSTEMLESAARAVLEQS